MAKCNNCFHNQVCDFACKRHGGANCIFFIDSSRIAEMHCKPGDIVFYMNRYRRNVWPMKIISVEINSQGINEYGCWCDVPESYTPICFKPIAIGKTVFFTQEEAKAELARRTANE